LVDASKEAFLSDIKEQNMNLFKSSTALKSRVLKDTMQAVRMHAYGGPDVLKFEEAPRPKPGVGEILVLVHAAAVNPIDWKIREGYLKQAVEYAMPLIPGWDYSGVVETTGPGADRFEEGDEVFGRGDITLDGAYAEYIVVKESNAAFKPKSVDHVHAAAVPIAALTAWQSLFDAGQIEKDQSVLIHAAAGGVGHFAVQLAKWCGAHVIGTASAGNQEFLRDLGVDEPVDYQTTRFEDVAHDVDVVLDTIGADTQKRSWKVLKKGGILVSIVSPPSQQEAEANGVRQAFVRGQSNAAQLAEIANLIDSGELMVVVETVLPLSQAHRAQELSQAGHIRGKIVLRVV
jgi:NADPH:quinone reductase-like Zn-dependent oxidoreductase